MAEERSENPRRNFLRSTFVAISTTTLGSGVRPLFGDEKVSKAAQTAGVPQRFLTESERSLSKPQSIASFPATSTYREPSCPRSPNP